MLSKGSIARDDSDDELGLEDHPWEWIYADDDDDEDVRDQTKRIKDGTPTRKRKAVDVRLEKEIVGAKMGSFRCKVGDTVLLKAENNEAWVGIICAFFEDEEEDEKMANFMWFSTPREIRNKMKRRSDALDVSHVNEIV